jgi:peroxiredoxin
MSFKVTLSTPSYTMSFSFVHGKSNVTLTGDPRDEKLLKKKRELEGHGMCVQINSVNDMQMTTSDPEHPFVSLHRGTILKPFRLKDIHGKWIDSSRFSGKLIHISIWSANNRSCIEEFNELNKLKKKYIKEDAVFIAIAPETRGEVNKVLKEYPLDYIVVPNARPYCEELGVDGYPKHMFIDREGMIVDVTEGSNYTGGMEKEEVVMIPNNFHVYDKAMQHLTEFGVLTAE